MTSSLPQQLHRPEENPPQTEPGGAAPATLPAGGTRGWPASSAHGHGRVGAEQPTKALSGFQTEPTADPSPLGGQRLQLAGRSAPHSARPPGRRVPLRVSAALGVDVRSGVLEAGWPRSRQRWAAVWLDSEGSTGITGHALPVPHRVGGDTSQITAAWSPARLWGCGWEMTGPVWERVPMEPGGLILLSSGHRPFRSSRLRAP